MVMSDQKPVLSSSRCTVVMQMMMARPACTPTMLKWIFLSILKWMSTRTFRMCCMLSRLRRKESFLRKKRMKRNWMVPPARTRPPRSRAEVMLPGK